MTKKSYDTILIEDFHHKLDLVIETMGHNETSSRQREQELKQDLTQEIQLTRYELKQDIALVQSAVQMLSKEVSLIHKRLDHHEGDITILKARVI
jgi:hypothetical protein